MNPAYSTKLNRKSRTRVKHTVPRYYGHAADILSLYVRT